MFLDTDPAGKLSIEQRVDKQVSNDFEATCIVRLVAQFVAGGADMKSIAVLSPYNKQLEIITTRLQDAGLNDVAVLTIDRSQGQDIPCVFVSMVRSNDENEIGELLLDARRLNVAITRAQRKLVVVGSKSTLSEGKDAVAEEQPAKQIVDHCVEKGWTVPWRHQLP